MKRKQMLILLSVLMVLILPGCGQADISAPGEGTVPAESNQDSTNSPAAPTSEPVEAMDLPDYLEHLDRITLLTPESGNGPRPILKWEAADGADRYGVYLYGSDGELYWSWQGRETEIPVGGRPQLLENALGPRVSDGMTWAVIGFNAEQMPVAAGGLRSINP